MKKLILALTTGLLFACTNTEEKMPAPAQDSSIKDSVKPVSLEPQGFDTIEVYHYKGAEPYINTEYLKGISEAEKALLAYYCYFFSTNCKDTRHCVLTDALGLGEQNSKEHKALVLKWFTDEETVQLVKEGGRIVPMSGKNPCWYEEIKLVKKGSDLVVVRYHSTWKTDKMEGKGRGTDEYQLTADRVKVIGRQHEDI